MNEWMNEWKKYLGSWVSEVNTMYMKYEYEIWINEKNKNYFYILYYSYFVVLVFNL